MKKRHLELLKGLDGLRSQVLDLMKKGCRLEGVLRDLDAAAAGVKQRLAYYKTDEAGKRAANAVEGPKA